ncbi:MAG TPA: plastocyanin/azurin family copper-binding protein [Longimicrobium sp.]|jgi:plastocyanin|uniref:plastocyanin/azurin family copper-binding protein n=1 Tax=Longimicrobium sp. TaxID=2029185 RepID=UPI002ED93920
MSIRKLPILGLLALAAACGGGDETEQAATTTENTAASGTPTVTTTPSATPAAPAAGAPVTPDAGGQVHEVRMVTTQGGASGEFQPKTLTVKKGDVIKWVMADGQAVHNVSFTMAQGNPGGFTPPADSPMYTQAGQSFELKVDMAPGTYNYVCVPHSMMGMTGSITVQ